MDRLGDLAVGRAGSWGPAADGEQGAERASAEDAEEGRNGASDVFQALLESQQRVEAALASLAAGQSSLGTTVDGMLALLQRGGDAALLLPSADPPDGKPVLGGRHEEQVVPKSASHELDGGILRHSTVARTDSHVAEALPADWPACLQPRPELQPPGSAWEVDDAASRILARRRVAALDLEDLAATLDRTDFYNRWFRDPACPLQLANVALGLLFLVHDLTFIPVIFAWNLEAEGYVLGAMVSSAVFWTLEIGVNALRGQYSSETFQLEPLRASACHYLRTWFLPDAAMVAADWISVWLATSVGIHAGAVRFTKLVRLLRLSRASRAMRMRHSFQRLAERWLPDHVRELLYLAELIFFGLWVCHVTACAWFVIARYADSDTGDRWTDRQVPGPDHTMVDFLECSVAYQYFESLRWAVYHLISLEGTEFPPNNLAEEAFAACSMCTGFFLGSLLICAVSTRLIEWEAMNRERSQNMRLLRRYLFQNSVAPDVTARILEQAHRRLSAPQWLDEAGVPVLESLSDAVISNLRHHICTPHLLSHPLLRILEAVDEGWFRHLSHAAVRIAIYNPEDEVFAANTAAVAAYLVVGGLLTYTQDPTSSPIGERTAQAVEVGAWVAESALWSEWVHVGTMAAVRLSKVMVVQANAFLRLVRRRRAISNITHAYGHTYHKRLAAAGPPLVQWPDDLQVPFTGFAELVYDIPHDISKAISLQVLEPVKDGGISRARGFRNLRVEVESGDSTVVLDGQGQPLRITSLVVLQVGRDEDRRVLWQIGRFADGVAKADLQMPGGRRHTGESEQQALGRLLHKLLQPLEGKLEVKGLRLESADKASKEEFGINTRCVSMVVSATLRGKVETPRFEVKPTVPRRTSAKAGAFRPSACEVSYGADSFAAPLVPEKFRHCPVFSFGSWPHCRAYAWLLPDEIHELGTKHGQVNLEAWVDSLVPPNDMDTGESPDDDLVSC